MLFQAIEMNYVTKDNTVDREEKKNKDLVLFPQARGWQRMTTTLWDIKGIAKGVGKNTTMKNQLGPIECS